jgi:GST-like protein
MIRLYGMGSPNVIKAMIMLEELGAAWAFEYVNVFVGEQFEPFFRVLNPNAKVPVMVEETAGAAPLVVAESGAILIHLAEKHGRFLAAAGPERAATLQWLMFQMASFGPMSGNAIHFRFVTDQDGYGRARFVGELTRLAGVVEDALRSRAFVAGETYTIADMALWPWFRTLKNFFPELTETPAIARWYGEIAARPAVERAVAFAADVAARDRVSRKAATPEQLDRYFGRTAPPT